MNKKDDTNATTLLTDAKTALKSFEKEAQGKPACFVVLGGKDNGKIYDLVKSTIIGGRDEGCDIPLLIQGVSRQHFKIEAEGGFFWLLDLNSSNGTYVNNEKVDKKTLLSKGDVVTLGKVALKYLPSGDGERFMYESLNQKAMKDPLTKAYNKGYFSQNLGPFFQRAKREGDFFSLILFDIDHFKKVNDTYGHAAGDYVLKEIVSLVQKQLSRDSILSRYGGEEFSIFVLGKSLKESKDLAEDLRESIENFPFEHNGTPIKITSSFGLTSIEKVTNVNEFFENTDKALYSSKKSGRNRVTVHE